MSLDLTANRLRYQRGMTKKLALTIIVSVLRPLKSVSSSIRLKFKIIFFSDLSCVYCKKFTFLSIPRCQNNIKIHEKDNHNSH